MFEEEKIEDQEFDGNVEAAAPVEEAAVELPGDDESSAAPSIDDQLREEEAAAEESAE